LLALIVALGISQGIASADDGLPGDAPAEVDGDAQQGDVIEGSYIVVMKDLPGNDQAAARRSSVATLRLETQRKGGKIKHVFSNVVNGFAAEMTADQAAALQADPAVAYVERDLVVSKQVEQVDAPWGLDRIDQRGRSLDGSYFHDRDGTGVDVYIADSGIRRSHDEFGGRVVGGYTAIFDGNGWDDCDGHGTHVAGTAGGATYGVAKSVELYAVRVLGCNGTGATSSIVAGLDWVIANANPAYDPETNPDAIPVRPSVVNVSIGSSASQAFDAAIQRVTDANITVVVAAANADRDACSVSPSRVLDAITVGAVMPDDTRASFSNYGSCLDLFAPGWQTMSAWYFDDDELNTISGTSMASPHVAGVAALYLSENPAATPADVAAAIIGGATPGTVQDAQSGSPNLMLYSYITADTPPPTDPPANPVAATTIDVDGNQAEGAGNATNLTIGFNHYPLTEVTIDWTATGGTANAASDLTEASGVVTLTAGDLDVDLTVSVPADLAAIDDADVEGDETFQLSLTVAGGAAGAAAAFDLVIVDNDDVPAGTAVVIDDFETDLGWAFDTDVDPLAIRGNFEIAAMNASPELEDLVYQLGSAVSSTNALVTAGDGGTQPGEFDVDAGSTSAERTISIPDDATYIEVSNYFAYFDNATADDVFELRIDDELMLREAAADNTRRPAAWTKVRTDVSAYAGQDVVFSASVGDLGAGSLIEAAVDDIIVYSNPFSCASDAGELAWTNAAQSRYWVYKSVDGGANFAWIGRTLGATTFTDPAPTVGALYQVHYDGIDRVVCTTIAEPDPAPVFACASDAGDLTWTDVEQSKYWVYKSVDGGATFAWIGRTVGATMFTDAAPSVGAMYQVHHAGIPRVGCTISAEPPDVPAFMCAANAGDLTWTDDAQSKYWVYKSTDGGATYVWIGRTVGATMFADSSSAPGDLYQVHYAGIPRVNCSAS